MSRPILPVAFACALLLALATAVPAQARVAQARIAKVTTGVATLEQVRVRLDWPAEAVRGTLEIRASHVSAPGLGMAYRDLHWRCPLQRNARDGWRCEGELRSGRGAPLRLAVDFDQGGTRASLGRGGARFALDRNPATPDLTTLDLTRVPVAWAQVLLSRAWRDARFTSGTFDARLAVEASKTRPLRIAGPLSFRDVGLETTDARIAGEHLGGQLDVDYRTTPALSLLSLEGDLRGGEFLVGNAYVALPASAIGLRVDAMQRDRGGWELPRIEWRDGNALNVEGSAAFREDASLRNLDVDVRSGDMTPLRQRYLSGWLGLFGLGEIDLHGAMDLRLQVRDGKLAMADASLHDVDIRDPAQRFVFDGLAGDVRYSLGAPVDSALRWRSGKLYGLDFESSRLPFTSGEGTLRFREDARVPLLGGGITFRDMVIRPPQGGAGADIRFGLVVDDIDVAQLSKALGLPAFQGRLSGTIPNARYANERVDFDGGLSMQLFDGRVEVSSLVLERPFGTAPSLSADILLEDLDLLRLTEVLGFGSISGRLTDARRTAPGRLTPWRSMRASTPIPGAASGSGSAAAGRTSAAWATPAS